MATNAFGDEIVEQALVNEFGDPIESEEEKAGVSRSIADSLVELGTSILGFPGDISQAISGQEPAILPTSAGIEEFLATTTVPGFEGTIHSGVGTPEGMSERTRGGEIAKVGTDVASIALPIIGATTAAARTIPLASRSGQQLTAKQLAQPQSTGGQIVQDILETTAKSPRAATGAELTAAGTSGIAAAGSEAVFPGDQEKQNVAAVAGAVFNPATTLPMVWKHGGKGINAVRSVFSKSGQEARASDMVRRLIEESGGDVNEVIRILKASDDGLPATAGVKTGDEGLLRLERYIAQKSPKAARDMHEANSQALEEMRGLADRLVATGDPQALKMAAQIRTKAFEDMVDSAINAASSKAAAAGGKLSSASTVEDTGEAAKAVADEAFNILHQTEKGLWQVVPEDVTVTAKGIGSAWKAMKNSIEPELLSSRVPKPIQALLNRYQKSPDMPSGKLKELRSELLSEARMARSGANPDADKARRLESLADSVMDDLQGLPGYDEARAFTGTFRDKFHRRFPGKTKKTTSGGEDVVAPEEVTQKAFGSGGAAGERKFRELDEAVGMASDDLVPKMQVEQEKFLRNVAERFVSEDGTVKAGAAAFIKKNKRLLERFPALKADVEDAQRLTARLKDAKRQGAARIKQLQNSAVAKIVGDESPSNAIGRMMAGKSPDADYKQLANTAKQSGEDAVAGLRSATLRNVSDSSGDFASFQQGLNKVLPMMEKNGVITAKEAVRLDNLTKRATTVEANIARAAGRADEFAGPVESEVLDTMIRIVGAKGGAAVAGETSGATLVAAGKGSQFLQKLLEKTPFNKTMEILEEAAANPKLMADLLTKHKGPKLREAAFKRVHAALIAAGIAPDEAP